MKKVIAILMSVLLLCTMSVQAEGILPNLPEESHEISLPSLSYVLKRFADKTETNTDESISVTYIDVTREE